MTKPSDYLAVMITKREEQAQPLPNEAVIKSCDMFLDNRKPPLFTTFLERSLPAGDR